MTSVEIPLNESMFVESAARPIQVGVMRMHMSRDDAGIATLRVTNDVGHADILPFDGQKIWDAQFHGRTLTMRSTFDRPVPGADYLGNNGAYFIHCGGSAMGNPAAADEHPLHGELPSARFQDVSLLVHDTEGGPAVTLTGRHTHRRSFGAFFEARMGLTIRAGSGIMRSTIRLTNRSREPRPLMYLAHINVRPADGGAVVDDSQGPRFASVRTDVHVGLGGETRFIAAPSTIDVNTLLRPGIRVEPELVQSFRPRPSADGWVRSRQVHADGEQDLVAYRSAHLHHTLRWLRRSADDDAFGFALPASAEPDGFAAEMAKGNIESFAPGASLEATIDHGALRVGETHWPADD